MVICRIGVAENDRRHDRHIDHAQMWLRLVSGDIGGQVDYKFSSRLKWIDFERAT